MASRSDILKNTSLFSQCSTRELSRIGALGSVVDVPAGEIIVQEGSVGDAFYVIDRGTAHVTIGGKSIRTLKAGDFIGELALLDDLPRIATVEARTPMRLFLIRSRDFARFLDQSPKVVQKMLAGLAGKLRQAQGSPRYPAAR